MGLFCQIGTHFFPARKDSVLAISIIPYWYLILRVLSARLHGGVGAGGGRGHRINERVRECQ